MNLNVVKNTLIKHGPSILTGIAMIGVAVTGYLVHRADRKLIGDVAEKILFEEDTEKPVENTVKEVAKKQWKNYIPAAVSGILTMGCIFGANHWHLSKEGALAAAALMYKANAEDLEKKLREEFGNDKVNEVKQKIREAREDKERPPWEEKPEKKMKVWDPYTKQYLNISQTDILWAENTVNRWLFNSEAVEYNSLIKLLGGKANKSIGEHFGWFIDDTFCWNSSYIRGGGSIQVCIDMVEDRLTLCYPIEPYDFSESL